MQHGLMYQGSFENNFATLATGAKTYRGTDGTEHRIPAWPARVDGVRVGYLEKAGKKFVAVRLQFESLEVVLKNPVLLDPVRHMGSKRFSPEPTIIDDDLATTLLDDAAAENPEQQREIALLLNRVNQVRRESRDRAAH